MFSINRDFFIKLTSFWFLHRWHPEVAVRYLPIVRIIQELGNNCSVLDVGSGGLGIVPYLNRAVVGLDTHFHPPIDDRLIQKKGSALSIPFNNKSFEIVLSVDMLEHLTENNRKTAIEEMIRVARRAIIIAVPCGVKSREQDILLDSYFKKVIGSTYHFLDEQIEYGLPQVKEVTSLILDICRKKKRKIKMNVIGNESLALRSFLMRGWITKNPVKNFIFRKLFLLAIPIFLQFNQEPFYRGIFYIQFEQ